LYLRIQFNFILDWLIRSGEEVANPNFARQPSASFNFLPYFLRLHLYASLNFPLKLPDWT